MGSFLEQGTGVEPAFTAWEAVVLPIYEPCGCGGIITKHSGNCKGDFVAGSKVNDRLTEQSPKTHVILSEAAKRRSRRIRNLKEWILRLAALAQDDTDIW